VPGRNSQPLIGRGNTEITGEIEVRVIDGTAVVTGKASADGRSRDGSYKGQYSFMDVYMKKSAGWQAILSAVNRAAPST